MSTVCQTLVNDQLPLRLGDFWEMLQADPKLLTHATAYAWAASRFASGLVLDVGCEYGFGSALLAKANPDLRVIGCDVDPEALGFAHGITGNDAGFVVCQAAASSLPFSSDAFSGVCLFNTLHLVADPSLILRETRRVLKPRQSLVVTLPRYDSLPTDWCTGRLDEHLIALVEPYFETLWFPQAVDASSVFPGMERLKVGAGTPLLVAVCH